MCGIAGAFNPNTDHQWQQIDRIVSAMTDAIAHRGPDAAGLHVAPNIALGHRRLSIIDVATGQQPLFNEDGSVAVVFNGEIYNYLELVQELEGLGHLFHTRSDTEVIVHAWEQWGQDCVNRFRGMFAFALWDARTKTFFLGRDRLGVKPLYYGFAQDGTVVFGSEIKALLVYPGVSKELDVSAIDDYFSYGYVPDPKSIYQSISKLSPAHTLVWKVGQSKPQITQYWDVRFEPTYKGSDQDAQEELRARLDEAIKIRLMSEVPLGAFLSGGVDSSAVVAMMSKHVSGAVKTCSVAFDTIEFDESKYAEIVAKQYKTDHSVETVTSDDYGLIDTLVNCYDEPFADSSAIPTFRVCEAARRRVTVALSGDGGDETFAGYRRYRFHLAEERLRSSLPLSIRRPIFGSLGAIYPKLDFAPRFLRAKATLQGLSLDPVAAYARSISFIRKEDRLMLYTPEFQSKISGYQSLDVMRNHAKQANTNDPLSLVQYLDYKMYLPGDINTKVDRTSMAHSLEVREPLMDHQLVDWTATLPSSMKLRNGEGKYFFKKSLEPLLSDDILYRKKMGFAVPLAKWFRGPLKEQIRASLTSEAFVESRIIDSSVALRILDEHLSNKRDRSTILWTLLMFSKFMEKNSLPKM
jgi:asparagine synthase (glutamine-hydrolysing)